MHFTVELWDSDVMHFIKDQQTKFFLNFCDLQCGSNDEIILDRVEKIEEMDKRVKRLTLYHTIPCFNDLKLRALVNFVGEGENARNQHFLLFSQYF